MSGDTPKTLEKIYKLYKSIIKADIFKTKSILHGLGQVRDRAFYFFWEGDKVPLLDYIWKPYERIEDTIRNTEKRLDDPMIQWVGMHT